MASKNKVKDMVAARNPLTRRPIAPVDLYSQPAEQQRVETPTVQGKPKQERQPTPPVKNRPKQNTTALGTEKKEVSHYSTYIRKDQIRAIKLRAVMGDCRDQSVVQDALDEYFKKHPL